MSCYGYYWSYDKLDNYFEKYRATNYYIREKQVDKFDLNGNLIETFKSLTDAAKSINTAKGNIYACCRGRLKTLKGFIWKYHTEKEEDNE